MLHNKWFVSISHLNKPEFNSSNLCVTPKQFNFTRRNCTSSQAKCRKLQNTLPFVATLNTKH